MRKCFLIGFLILLQACAMAGTKMTSFKDPGSQGKRYQHLVVIATIPDLMIAKNIEDAFVKELNEKGVMAIADKTLFPPTGTYSLRQVKATLSKNKIDGILMVKITDQYTNRSVVANSYIAGNNLYTNVNNITRLRQRHNVALKDAKTFRFVWMSSAFTGGNGYAGSKTLMNSLVRKTLTELASANLITINKVK